MSDYEKMDAILKNIVDFDKQVHFLDFKKILSNDLSPRDIRDLINRIEENGNNCANIFGYGSIIQRNHNTKAFLERGGFVGLEKERQKEDELKNLQIKVAKLQEDYMSKRTLYQILYALIAAILGLYGKVIYDIFIT